MHIASQTVNLTVSEPYNALTPLTQFNELVIPTFYDMIAKLGAPLSRNEIGITRYIDIALHYITCIYYQSLHRAWGLLVFDHFYNICSRAVSHKLKVINRYLIRIITFTNLQWCFKSTARRLDNMEHQRKKGQTKLWFSVSPSKKFWQNTTGAELSISSLFSC